MPKLTKDLNETWYLEGYDFQRWEVVNGVTIDAEGHGVFDYTDGSHIVVNGTVIAKPRNGADAYVGIGGASTVTIGRSGHVDASQVDRGIYADDDDARITNHGLIEAGEIGIFGFERLDVENFGTIRAEKAVYISNENFTIHNAGLIRGSISGIEGFAGSHSTITNDKGGIISGAVAVMTLGQSEESLMSIFNEGTIKGETFSIRCPFGTIEIVNRGRIVGDVLMGTGADLFNTRGGNVNGLIYGGGGDDTYIIDKSDVRIVENGSEGLFDTVKSTVTFRLSDNIEGLQLLGQKNVNAFGNGGDNILAGNAGNNTLNGGLGADTFYGLRGDDKLIGGAGADLFVFGKQYEKDTIRDFEDGIDQLYLLRVTNQQEFDALRIRQAGDDLIIDYGSGDQLVIEDLRKRDLTLDDLVLS